MEKILAIIPARGGSKGLPRKNILKLLGKAMIGYTIEAARASKYIDKVVVSTEDEEIAEIARQFGAEVPFLRPKELAQDDTPGIEPILYTMREAEKFYNVSFDVMIMLQPTSPLRGTEHIDAAIEQYRKNRDHFDSLISVTELEHPVEWNRTIDTDGKLQDFLWYEKEQMYSRQRAQKVYRLNGAIYIVEKEALFRTKRFETGRTQGFMMNTYESIDVDTKEDFCYAEFLMSKWI